eukprot:SAG31_NODE_1165_length_9578_cov_5.386011_2_plen_68_part_00
MRRGRLHRNYKLVLQVASLNAEINTAFERHAQASTGLLPVNTLVQLVIVPFAALLIIDVFAFDQYLA